MPHRRNVEAAADSQAFREVGQVDGEEEDVGQALVAFTLEVVLGEPEGVIAEAVHLNGEGLGSLVGAGEMLVRVPAFVDRRSLKARVLEVNLAGVKRPESLDHAAPVPRIQA